MKVTLREKPLLGNRLRLYLDYYPAITHPTTGKATRREFLSLFVHSETELTEEKYTNDDGKELSRIIPVLDSRKQPKKIRLSPLERQHNKETYLLAENIKAQRQLQIQAEDYGFLTIDKNADFLLYFKGIADKLKDSKGDNNYISTYNYFFKFCKGNCSISKVTPALCQEFKEYLLLADAFQDGRAKLSSNTTSVYYSNFLNIVRKSKLLTTDEVKEVGKIKRAHSKSREYLTQDELKAILKTPCTIPLLKDACMFSALTGLRWSDIEKLTWGEVFENNGRYHLRFVTQKTDTAETLPISNQAYSFLGERGAANKAIFAGLKYSAWQNIIIERWIRAANINKHITFHCFRHSYATLQITLGTDLYTVSKMLGHKNIATTQIYAKIIDEKKREAADKVMIEL